MIRVIPISAKVTTLQRSGKHKFTFLCSRECWGSHLRRTSEGVAPEDPKPEDDDRAAPRCEGRGAKHCQRRSSSEALSFRRLTLGGSRCGTNQTKSRRRRPAVEGACPMEERITRSAEAEPEGPAGNVTVKVSELRGGPLAGPDIIHCSDHCCNVTLMPTEYSQIVAIRGHYGDFTLTGSWAAGYKYPCNCPWWDIEYKDLLPVLWFSCHWAKCRSPSRLRPRRTGLLWYLFARKDILHQQWNSTIFFKV